MAKKKKRRHAKDQLGPRDYLEAEQIRFINATLKAEAKDGGFRATVNLFIFQMLLITGLRRGELVGLELRDLPCVHGKNCIDVRRPVAKNRHARRIELSKPMVAVINRFVDKFRRDCGPRTPLLINERGRRMTGKNVYKRVKTVGRKTGIY